MRRMAPLATPSRAGLRACGWRIFLPLLFVPLLVQAQITLVSDLTSDWRSDDTRSAAGVNLVGSTLTHQSLQGGLGSSADDAAIAARLSFVADASSINGAGYLRVDASGGSAAKATLSLIDAGGFASAESLLSADFSASYDWMKPDGGRNLAFRFGIQTASWAGSQSGFTAARTGEAMWDLVLVFIKPATATGAWESVSIDRNTAGWFVYDQAGNTFWDALPLGGEAGVGPCGGSLLDWAAYDIDAVTPGVQTLFDEGTVTSIQFGLGSAQPGVAYLAGFDSSVLAGGYAFAAVPEPSTAGLILAAGALGLAVWRRRAGRPSSV